MVANDPTHFLPDSASTRSNLRRFRMADLIDMHLSTFIYAGRLDYNLLLFVHVLHLASTEKDTDPRMSSCCIVKS